MKTLIKNGMVIDGTGRPGFYGELALDGECIESVGVAFNQACFDQVIDAKGKVVAPGFIDTHSHSAVEALSHPCIEYKIRQGVTTEVIGQDGISTAPLPRKHVAAWRKNLTGFDGDSDKIDWDFASVHEYLKIMEEGGVGLNEAYLVPHGNIRAAVLGLDNRKAMPADVSNMQAELINGLETGAFGISTGLIYAPCVFADAAELINLCKVVAKYNGVFAVHQRSEANDVLSSMREVLAIGRKSGVKVHFSHFKLCGRKNWHLMEGMLKLLDEARAEGIQVSFDQYPYVAGSTMLSAVLPPWVHEGGVDKLLTRLTSSQLRRQIVQDIENGLPGWDNFIDFAGFEQIFITSVASEQNQDLIGKNLVEIGQLRGKDVYEAVFDLLYEENNAVGMVDFYGEEYHIKQFLQRPEQNVCTDGIYGENPHPRLFGAFPRILGKYVREEKTLSLEAAIAKMTGKPAETFGIERRGKLRAGYFADIVIFDAATVADKGTFAKPKVYPVGIEQVFVNGRQVVQHGVYHTCLAGKVLRK
ncbi:amidohydrolase family protein [Sporomusa sp. KB1]|jgi:N-acyl-D-amino-acid deacylase|uniref:N-acyl-D-amino-acid deacylase family protein n=1 Tax=Sporomusa sp. KB1 TaxID=943346 RepID=UPI0011A1D5F1|nr:D-aminoacylase [Sporomusa sp. KB1]TWH52051.1 N-acyl-D-amino-acid deacylase [Sporomusa sp. KB1]